MKGVQQLIKGGCSVFLTHGAGPFPILQKAKHITMSEHLQKLAKQFQNPKGIIIFSAHWQESQFTILDHDAPPLLYDYYGFPEQAYSLKYPAKSTAELRHHIKQSLLTQGIKLKSNTKRGYDHGVFIPLAIMYPEANVPVVQISILSSLDPEEHYRMGKALRGLKHEGFLILGSGSSVHGGFGKNGIVEKALEFSEDLSKIALEEHNEDKIFSQIKNWRKLRNSKLLHPRQQHLVPFFLNIGCYEGKGVQEQKYVDPFMGLPIRNYVFN